MAYKTVASQAKQYLKVCEVNLVDTADWDRFIELETRVAGMASVCLSLTTFGLPKCTVFVF